MKLNTFKFLLLIPHCPMISQVEKTPEGGEAHNLIVLRFEEQQ